MLDNWHFSLAGSLVLESVPGMLFPDMYANLEVVYRRNLHHRIYSVPGMLCLDMHAALKVVYRRIVQYPIYTDPWLAGSSLT